IKNCSHEDRLLIVDDVFDSGRSIEALIQEINKKSRLNTPKDIRVACTWYKPGKRAVDMEPDYYVHKNDDWLVFPHELDGLTRQEVIEGKTDLKAITELF
ncbi:MAG: phosphoribosyltransferase, partial [Gammaproteobacteria bacterium]